MGKSKLNDNVNKVLTREEMDANIARCFATLTECLNSYDITPEDQKRLFATAFAMGWGCGADWAEKTTKNDNWNAAKAEVLEDFYAQMDEAIDMQYDNVSAEVSSLHENHREDAKKALREAIGAGIEMTDPFEIVLPVGLQLQCL